MKSSTSKVGQKLLIIVAVSLAVGFTLTKMLESVVLMLSQSATVQVQLQELQIQVEEFNLKAAEFNLKQMQHQAVMEKEAKDLELRNKAFDGVKATIRQLELQNHLLKQQIDSLKKGQPNEECPFEFRIVPPPGDESILKRNRSAGYRRSSGSQSNSYCGSNATLSYASTRADRSTWTQLGHQRDPQPGVHQS